MTTILQISDPHLLSTSEGTLRGVPTSRSLELVLARARDEVADPARVILSGDLSHEHTVAGYELLKDLLGDWSGRSLLIPGNHDDRQGMRTVFEQVPGEASEDVGFRDELDGWQLIGLDSHVPGELYGELSESALAQLQSWLGEDPGRPTIIFIHHPPLSVNSPWIDRIGLRNSSLLEAQVRHGHAIRGIFSGHIHQVYEGHFCGIPFYTTPAVSFQFVPQTEEMQIDLRPPGFRVIDFHEAQFSTRVVRLNEMPFTPTSA